MPRSRQSTSLVTPAPFVINNAASVGQILMDGGDGPDWVLNTGNSVSLLRLIGGTDGDLLTNRGQNVASIVFHGDAGADTLVADGHGGLGSSITADGNDGDVLVLRGSAATVQLRGGAGG